MELLGSGKKAEGFYNPTNPGDFGFLNGDLAFKGNIIVQGGFHGFQVWDISDSHNPRLRSTSSARADRATRRSIETCCSSRSRKRAAASTAADGACRTR